MLASRGLATSCHLGSLSTDGHHHNNIMHLTFNKGRLDDWINFMKEFVDQQEVFREEMGGGVYRAATEAVIAYCRPTTLLPLGGTEKSGKGHGSLKLCIHYL